MKTRRKLGTRICSIALAACILLGLLPMSAIIALATVEKPVSVMWEPRTQTEDGVVTVELSASLTQSEGGPAAAMIEITLDEVEAAALDQNALEAAGWGKIAAGDLTPEDDGESTTNPPVSEDTISDVTVPDDPTTGEDVPSAPSADTSDTDEPTTGGPDADVSNTDDPSDVTAPTGADPDVTTPSEADPDTTDPTQTVPDVVGPNEAAAETTVPDTAETAEETGTITGTRTLNDAEPDSQAVLITDVEDGGAVLRILLSGDQPRYLATLTFSSSTDTLVSVQNEDIRVGTYSDSDLVPDITAAPLLESGSDNVSIETTVFTVYADIPEEIDVSAESPDINLDDDTDKPTIPYTVKLQKTAAGSDGKNYTFTVTLPEGLALPEGALTSTEQSGDETTTTTFNIQCGETVVATLQLPEGLSLEEDTLLLNASDNGFSFTVSVPKAEFETPAVALHEILLTLDAEKLTRSTDEVSGSITLTVSAEDDETTPASASASVAVTAGENFPGQGDWPVVGSNYQQKTQQIYWADNNDVSGRPGWSRTLGDTSEGTMTPKLYFTLTQVNEDGSTITFTRQELTEDNLDIVGLADMPKVSYDRSTGVLSVNAADGITGLPTELVERDGNGNELRHYTVSWSLEPPDTIPGGKYTLQDIEDPEQVDGVEHAGWYFVRLQDFTVTLDVQQGIARELNDTEVQALLKNFSFHWDYDGMPDGAINQNTLADMLENGLNASYENGEITISGLWEYSINGTPITYYLTETADDGETSDTADGRLSGGELPESLTGKNDPLDEDDWYNILYNNTSIPNTGHVTTAVYNGGTLTLVRGGETTYTATKVWMDSYEQNPEDSTVRRPDVTFTLYRYLRSEGIHTASNYAGEDGQKVKVILVWVEDAAGDGGDPMDGTDDTGSSETTGGEDTAEPAGGRWEIQVVYADSEELADLPQYDGQSGSEWIYVVRETLDGTYAGQYEQQFGKVTWDSESGKWVVIEDDLTEWGAERAGNPYLYNGDKLTNLQSNTVSANATKVWKAANFQSGFDNVAVELTLQVHEVGQEDGWSDYTDESGDKITRYLYDFSAVKLTDTLTDRLAMPQYSGNGKEKLEYRWLETAVYTGVTGDTREDVTNAIENDAQGITKYPVTYGNTSETSSCTSDAPTGTLTVEEYGRSYAVSYDGETITNSVQDTVSYEVIKEWHGKSLEEAMDAGKQKITLQIFRAVTGGVFNYETPYLEITMDGTNNQESVSIKTAPLPSDAPEVEVSWGISDSGYTPNNQATATWPATVTGLPAYDADGQAYEYILLELTDGNVSAVYENRPTDTADYRTAVINGGPGEGFNLLVRKTWLDNSDTPHREPVTFTLYNKTTGEPIQRKNSDETTSDYTITLGPNIWSSVVWIGSTGITEESKETPDGGTFDANDVFLVETSVGVDAEGKPNEVNNQTKEITPTNLFTYLYRDRESNEPIFEVTTQNHRYQVTYDVIDGTDNPEEGTLPGGVDVAFTVTNRRLGNINLTVNKHWVDGRTRDGGEEVSDTTLSDEIGAALEKIYQETSKDGKEGTRLALVFRLVFDESMNADTKTDWEITYSGPYAGDDTVSVGGEDANIYTDEDYNIQASSEQTIIGLNKETGNAVTNNTAHFYGLPKYDSDGNAVAYSVKEVWLDVTNADSGTPPKEVTLSEMQTEYPKLYALWSDYTDPEFEWDYDNNVDGRHTLDIQTLDVTNRRNTPKNVSWTKVWMDNYTNESGLRPDLYLDIYRVVHVAVPTTSGGETGSTSTEGGTDPSTGQEPETTTTYERRIEYVGSSGDWQRNGDNNTWTLTLENVAAFDRYGYEIYYYAVERTTQPADRYDYQAGKYSLKTDGEAIKELGTRDEAADGADILSADTEQESGDHAYDLLVLGKRAEQAEGEEDSVDSIQWVDSADQPDNIGPFGNGSNYAKYALVENGTFTNTLAEEYSINGMKYWTNLSGWDTETRLPGVKFLVYRYTQDEAAKWGADGLDGQIKDSNGKYVDGGDYYVAQLTISPNQWSQLKSGNGYQYQILYNGTNTLKIDENGELKCEGTEDAAKLERYDENGNLYTYEIREVVQWADKDNDLPGDAVFTVSQAGNGFYFTNKYDPDTGSIQVKKFLYLPMGEDGQPEAFPAVTFRLVRYYEAAEGDAGTVTIEEKQYVEDDSFHYDDVTLTSAQVREIWNNQTETPVTGENLIDSGKGSDYIWATLKFAGLPLYAPDGTEYRYGVSEVKTWLNGYDTWGVKEDVTAEELGTKFDDDTKLKSPSGITTPITGLTPEMETVPGNSGEGETATASTVTVDASFKNQRSTQQEVYDQFIATKIWEGDDTGFRPKQDDFAKLLTLTRTTQKQGGEGGAAEMEETLTQGEDYTITFDPANGNSDTWIITIKPADGKSFEKYAPNGMAWTYTLKERVDNGRLKITEAGDTDRDNIYTPTPGTGVWPISITDSASSDFGTLTNSTLTHADFQKVWQGSDGTITEDYLGFDLTVELQLQVREMGSDAAWENANEWTYDGNKTLNFADGATANSLTGPIAGGATIDKDGATTARAWFYSFKNLPGVVQDANDRYIFLEYRVIETAVSWGTGNQPIDLPDTGSDGPYFDYEVGKSLVTSATFNRNANANTSTSTNKLDTTSVSVTKVWDDTDNQYGTRPGADGPWTWGSWFVLQRATDADNSEDESVEWENVAVFEKLYGNNAESANDTDPDSSGRWTDTITGLPTMDYSAGTAKPYTYRVRELQPKDGGYNTLNDITADAIVAPGGTYNPGGVNYTAKYSKSGNDWTVTNSLDTPPVPSGVPQNVVAVKEWAGEEIAGSVTFQLQYMTETTSWTQATFLNGQEEKAANASNSWTVRWDDLPETDNSGSSITGYQVVEVSGSGWVQIGEPKVIPDESTGTTTYYYTFTNSVTTSYSVEKRWNPSPAPTGASVTLALYRTTEQNSVGSVNGEAVPVDELAPDGVKRTVVLDGTVDAMETIAWCSTFTNLPKYDANGAEYIYYALELENGTPIPQNGSITIDGTSYEVSYDWTKETRTTVTNTTATSLTGTKTWVDNDNAYHTRPGSLTLILERKTDTEGNWTNVSDIYSPTWTDSDTGDTNVWTYTYAGLPCCDANGAEYTYRVREDVPDGYDLRDEVTSGQGDVKPDVSGNYNFTNVLTGTVTISGQKIWNGGVGSEPTLTLERRLSGSTDETAWTEVTVTGQPTWVKNGNTWTYTYTDLPKYNEDGVLYEYRVREDPVPSGYEDGYKDGSIESAISGHPDTPVDGLTITNYKDGSLTVSKTVSGNRGDQNKDFTFTVKLTGSSSAGTAASDVDDSFNTTKTDADGNATSGMITFTDGVSGEFTLKHDESITIQGLPAGIGYEVVEKEMDQNGYRTSGTGWIGEIPAGGTASAAFENYRHDSGGGDDDRIDLTGTKTWVDDGENDSARPVSITLYLFRQINGGPEERVYAQPTWVKNGNTWTYTFHDLPEEDENGNKYTYFVQEKVPEGYQPTYDGNNITNRKSDTAPGSLQVSKRVTGSAGDPTREFTFTVTLSNRNLTGIYGQMTFVNGVATFTLHDGETILAENLPDGITYTVTEAEADQDGYSTTAAGDTGTITAGGTASAVFTNHRPGSDPDDPDEPIPPDPSEPGDPDEPSEPDTPDTPSNPDTPRTGDPTHNGLLALLCLLSLGGMAVVGLPRLLGRKYRGKRLR